MREPILLASGDVTLTITLDERGVGGWAQVALVSAGVRRPLGAERLSYLAARLVAFLSDPVPSSRWVASLAERHTSAYGEHVEGGAVLRLQDRDGEEFTKVMVTTAEGREWLAALTPLVEG
jgi:hypothetical protein